MTIIGDNLNKLEAKFQAFSDVMAKKRKLYLLNRPKCADCNLNYSAIDTKTEETASNSLKSVMSLNKKSKSTSLAKCSFRSFCSTSCESTIDAEKNHTELSYSENSSELCICNESIRLNESDDYCTSPFKEDNNCSCNKNCHSNCRLSYHHNKVLKNKSAQKSSASQHFYNTSNHQEIYKQNSYYLLRNLQELNSAQTVEKSCATTSEIMPSTNINMKTVPACVQPITKLVTKFPKSQAQREEAYSLSHGACNNNFPRLLTSKNSKIKFILQFCNIFMILKMLLVFVARVQPFLPSVCRNHDSQQNSYLQIEQRLRDLEDEQYSHCKKQKLSLQKPNVSFTKMILISLSFLSIFLPLSQSLSFETTFQSALSALERTPRDVGTTSEITTDTLLPYEQVRLSRPEHVCKSLDIRNTAEQFQQVENCTVIEGFLLITLLSGNSLEDYNGTFPLLTEITDYLIVHQVHYLRSIGRIFPNLSIIRGNILFQGYALIVYSNSHLEELGLSKLTTISNGGVRIEKNIMLCFVKSIDWSQIVSNTTDIVIEENRDSIECPSCPGDSSAGQNELSCKEHQGQRHCWNSNSCQKFCPKRCRNNCVDENTCCNEACIGGCSPNNLNECISCRNFSIYNTTCTDKCPDNYYKYLNRRCLTAESCSIIGTKYENNRQEVLVAYDGSCSTSCPEGYMKKNLTCEKCGNKCTKRCEGTIIDRVARAIELRGCTHIVQSPLVINIRRGGRNLMEKLSEGLSAIISIETSLKVHDTFGLFNLKFFKNLRRIEGQNLIEHKYALYVVENNDIETIWNPNQTVQIFKGGAYFHFNPKLCLSEINSLLPMFNLTSFDETEVAQDMNGFRGTCNASLLNVTVISVGSLVAFVSIDNPIEYEDERTFIGYQFLHTEDPYGNATKHAFRPCEDTWEISDPNKATVYLFQNLKPYTRYSFYVKTLTISSERRNAQSEIHHFKTKSDEPQRVNKLKAYSNSSHTIVMNWLPPFTVNGKLIKYKIRAIYDKEIQRIEHRNYCKDPLEISKWEIPLPKVTEKPTIPKTCNCKKTNALKYDDADTDASIHESIELENALQNFVYVKKNRNETSTRKANSNELLDQKNNRNRRAIESDNFDSFLLRHIRDVPDDGNLGYDTTTTISSTNTSISSVDPHNEDNLFYNETRMDTDGNYFKVVVDSVNASNTEYVFTKLRHFSYYMLGVKACREKDSENDTSDCSIEVKIYVRTLKLENVDRVENLRAEKETTNSSRSNIRLFWERPTQPNGAVVSYTIYYLLKSPDAVEEKKCITDADYIELGYHQYGYVLTNLNTGNYSIRIVTNTLAGEGLSSKVIYVDTTPATMPVKVVVALSCGAILIVILVIVVTYYLCRKRLLAPPSDLKMFPSVNPHYMSLQYIPDEWEVVRDRVIQLSPLGQGSFGMVYEGILKGYNEDDDDTPCAIKTVNESSTDRERLNFLKEACVMKQFDTYHVVHLLGVCSREQPCLVIMELMKNGDLKSYLRAHRPDDRDEYGMPLSARSEHSIQPPSMQRIYQMAIEIADGMSYLAAKKYVHRDLAARNCMVAADLTVKIGDFGMTRDIYENDYYRKGTKGLLPVRWMPPESLKDGIYSTASDVFSYGVVLWEMATLASQPYQGLSNDQVLRYVIDGGVMERPENCPDKLYKIMQKCWHHRAAARPTFMSIISDLIEFANSNFETVSFFCSTQGRLIWEKESQVGRDNLEELNVPINDAEDVTTPLRLEEFSGYKLKVDNNSSVEHPGDTAMAIDDDAPHSPFSLAGSPLMASSATDGHVRNNYNMSRIINSHNQVLNSAPSTSTDLRKTGTGISSYPHPHTHPHHRNLYQPTRYSQQQQQARYHHSDDVDSYVPPDFEFKDLVENKGKSDEQSYEMYDPSPNYSEKIAANVHDDEDDDINVHSTAGQNLLAPSKSRQRQPTIMPLSSSMPDEVIGQPPSFLHPSTASAASSNTSSKTGRYAGLRAAADSLGNNVSAKFRSILFNTHKRSGSNASHKSTSSNPKSATAGSGVGVNSGSSNNLTRGGRGKSMSGQNLGTIESGGSGSAGSYCANPQLNAPNSAIGSTSENPNYKRLGDEGSDTLQNKSKLPVTSAFSMSSNPNYQVLDESLNTTDPSISTSNAAMSSPLLQTTDNPNYQLMQAPAIKKNDNVSSYVMMNEPKAPTPSAISMSSNPNYQMMGPTPSSLLTAPTSSSVLPQPLVRENLTKYSSSSSAVSTSSNQETDDDDDIPAPKGIKSDCIPLSRVISNDRSQKKKHSNNRSRSQSSSSSSRSNNTVKTALQQNLQQSAKAASLLASSKLLTKENWLKQQPTQSHHLRSQPPPPPNGFVGRETS